ncbi:MAG: PAS domain-containing protein [Planctomycetes bacterium]|nr:PAS domain-containing protein [Planctomycetota bacterium]
MSDSAAQVSELRAKIAALEQEVARLRQIDGEHARAEAELRAGNEFLNTIAATLPAAVIMFEAKAGKYTFVSDAFEKIFGYPRQRLVEGGFEFALGLYHPDDRDRVLGQHMAAVQAFESGQLKLAEPVLFESRMRHADGSYRWIHTYGTVFDTAPDGSIHRILNINVDVTEQKEAEFQLRKMRDELEQRVAHRTENLNRANEVLRDEASRRQATEAALHENVERFNQMIHGAKMGLWDTRVNSEDPLNWDNPIYYSPHLKKMFGHEPHEFPDTLGAFFSRVHPEDLPGVYAALDRHLRDRVPYQDIEYRVFRRDGEMRWFLSRGQALWDEQGRPVRMSGAVADITARKVEEAEKIQEQEFLQSVLKSHESDRQLMAYELHDGLLQDLTGGVWELEGLRGTLARFSPDELARVDKVLALLRQSLDEGRRLLSGLRPPILDEQGIVAALDYLVAEHRLAHPIDVTLSTNVQFKRLESLLEVTIFRIAQQALANIVQHSRSDRAEIRLTQLTESLHLAVRDWGVGFEVDKVAKDRFGLLGINRRAKLAGGEAQVVSQPNRGTLIFVRLPLVRGPVSASL